MEHAYFIVYDADTIKSNADTIEKVAHMVSVYWYQITDCVWLIRSSLSPNEIFDKMKKRLISGDRPLIIEAKNNKQGLLPQSDWDFLNKDIFNER